MPLFIRELMRNRKSFIVWTLCLVLLDVFMLAFFPYMGEKAKAMEEMYKQFPKELIAAVNLDTLDFSKILSYFAYVFQYLIIFAAANAVLLGASIISKEESDKTIEFLMAKPVTRTSIVTSKALSVFAYLTAFNALFFVINYFTMEAMSKESFSFKTVVLLQAGLLMMQLTFAAVGLLISVFIVKTKSVLPAGLAVVFGTYFLSIASAISEKLQNFKYLTPFKYVNPADIVKNERIEVVYIVIMFIVMVVSVAATYVFYNKKNITI